MTDELQKMIRFIVFLALCGSLLGYTVINHELFIATIIFISTIFTLIFNFILTSVNLGWAIAIIAIFLLLLFVIIIATISTPISKLGVYYKAKPFPHWREPVLSNIVEVFLNYLILSIPLYFTIMYLLNNANFFVAPGSIVNSKEIIDEFKISLVIIPGYLLSIRLLANPMEKRTRIPIASLIIDVIKKYYSEKKPIDVLKERVISFYFSLTASTFFIMVMLWIYRTIPLTAQSSTSEPLGFWGMVIQGIQLSFIPQFSNDILINSITIFWFIGAYIFALFFLTVVGEAILDHYIPVDPENRDPELTLMIFRMINLFRVS
jgi:hypothetical protein